MPTLPLTPADLDRLAAAGESFTIEFKGEERREYPDGDLVEAIVCLANGQGGTLLVGVEDDGRITGARPRHEAGQIDPRRIEALVSNRTRPGLSVQAEVVQHARGPVLAIHVPRATVAVATSDGRYVRRAILGKGEPGCVPFFAYEMAASGRGIGGGDPTLTIMAGATWSDLDPLEFERMRRFIREARGRGDASLLELSDVELAKALGAVEANGEVRAVRLLGLLLFGREEALRRLVPTHEVAFQDLAGTSVGANDFVRWPLLRVFEEMTAQFRHRNRSTEVMAGPLLRIDVPDYAEASFREALANAFVHRDYATLGAIHVQWHPDHLRVDSPGGFPEGVRLDNLLVTPPRPRNPMLADAFKRAGLVERTGRGIDTIFEGQLRFGRNAPSYALSDSTSVTLVLPGGPANLAFTKFVAEEGSRGEPLFLLDLLVVNELSRERDATTARLAALMQRSDDDARQVVNRLVERGLVESRGHGRGRTVHLSAQVYRRIDAPAAYVRTRGFEPIQHEQMVLQFVKAHSTITRGDTVRLCMIDGQAATRLLGRLVKKYPEFVREGTRRGAHYTWRGPTK
jgi:ATP-dependent DNA helicase RecG